MSATQGTVSKFQSLADGTLRLQIDIHQTDTAQALSLLCEVGRTVAVAALVDVQVPEPDELTAEGGPMQSMDVAATEDECDNNAGKLMQSLYQAGWFHAPKVLKALGKDAMFLQWVRQQPRCWACDGPGLEEYAIVAAHYRKVASGAGTSIKPPYSAIPLCKLCHDKQHAHGYSVISPAGWWEEKVAKARQDWGHQRMRDIFETTSMTAVPAKWVVEWAVEHELTYLVPQEYLA